MNCWKYYILSSIKNLIIILTVTEKVNTGQIVFVNSDQFNIIIIVVIYQQWLNLSWYNQTNFICNDIAVFRLGA